jgi:hypothetical protein
MVPCRRYGKGDRVNASKSTCVSSPIFGDRQGSPAVAPMVPQVAALIGPRITASRPTRFSTTLIEAARTRRLGGAQGRKSAPAPRSASRAALPRRQRPQRPRRQNLGELRFGPNARARQPNRGQSLGDRRCGPALGLPGERPTR